MAKIVIDPGHGGTTKIDGSSANNATGPDGTLEKTLTLALGKRTVTALRAAGHEVKITRTGDNNLGLAARAHVARDMKADAFVSIHFNASDAHNAQGTETFVHSAAGPHSGSLCRAVQAQVLKATELTDRNKIHGGVKKASFGVLAPADHHPGTAAVLTEVSFLDRADEEDRLRESDYLEAIAQSIARGVADYVAALARPMAQRGAVSLEDAVDLSAQESGMSVKTLTSFAAAAPAAIASRKPASKAKKKPVRSRATPARAASDDDQNDINELPDILESHGAGAGPLAAESIIVPPGFDISGFEALIGGLGLRHFQAREFLEMGARNDSGPCAGTNSPPPRAMWSNIVNTALMLDEIRHRLGYSIRLISVFRAAPYNTCIGGASAGKHKVFNACDFLGSQGNVTDWHQTALAVRSSQTRFRGGVGLYNTSNFVHVDTRGANEDWTGN
jgi:N-acetylmuramoyl-L-alanine amidase